MPKSSSKQQDEGFSIKMDFHWWKPLEYDSLEQEKKKTVTFRASATRSKTHPAQ